MGQKLNHFLDCLFVQFVADFGLNLAPPKHPKWGSRLGAVHILQIWALCCFVAFWIDFWPILDGSWDLRWLQNAYKIDPKANQKPIQNYIIFLLIFLLILLQFGLLFGSNLGAPGWAKTWLLHLLLALGAVLGPRWPQDPSKRLPGVIFGSQLGGFWAPNSWIFDPICIQFLNILCPFALMEGGFWCLVGLGWGLFGYWVGCLVAG